MSTTFLALDDDRHADILLRALFRNGIPAGLPHDTSDLVDLSLLRTSMTAMSLCLPSAPDREIVELYIRGAARNLLSPNPLFDEAWYRTFYGDVDAAVTAGDFISGFSHFLTCGVHEGRWPNFTLMAAVVEESAPPASEIDPKLYRYLNIGARSFLKAFSWVSDLEHYNLYGRHLNYGIRIDRRRRTLPDAIGLLVAEIDADYYRKRYLAQDPDRDPIDHYLGAGAAAGHSPAPWFDEGWYRSFYADVHRAIRHGDVISGFHHYIVHGRQEGRLASFDLKFALETKIPGVTDPALLNRLPHLRARLAVPRRFNKARDPAPGAAATIWFLLPFLNVDIAFGGYAAVFALIKAVRRDGFAVGILCMEEQRPNVEYFLWRQTDPDLRAVLSASPILGRAELDVVAIQRGDRFVAYSIWDLSLASHLAAIAGSSPPFLLLQEYEPVFHDNGSLRTLCGELYAIEHVPIVNSHFLLAFLRRNQIGAFRDGDDRPAGRSNRPRFHVFEHRINRLQGQSALRMRARTERVLVAYARPEAHAARNLFEIVLMALQRVCERGVFGPEWSFVGLGALSELPDIELGHGHSLRLAQKMDEADYVAFMRSVDIGISLMSAPHPSVVPFELATTGALVVTNTYENRSAADLTGICENIVPCAESLSGVVDALLEAARRVGEFGLRERRTYRPASPGWDEIFSTTFIREVFEVPDAAGDVAPRKPRPGSRNGVVRRLAPVDDRDSVGMVSTHHAHVTEIGFGVKKDTIKSNVD